VLEEARDRSLAEKHFLDPVSQEIMLLSSGRICRFSADP
jgi:hypothetical protein